MIDDTLKCCRLALMIRKVEDRARIILVFTSIDTSDDGKEPSEGRFFLMTVFSNDVFF